MFFACALGAVFRYVVGDEVMQVRAVLYVLGDINAAGGKEESLLSNCG